MTFSHTRDGKPAPPTAGYARNRLWKRLLAVAAAAARHGEKAAGVFSLWASALSIAFLVTWPLRHGPNPLLCGAAILFIFLSMTIEDITYRIWAAIGERAARGEMPPSGHGCTMYPKEHNNPDCYSPCCKPSARGGHTPFCVGEKS